MDWSRDGHSLLFTSHRDHSDNYTDVYVMRPDPLGRPKVDDGSPYAPVFSRSAPPTVFDLPATINRLERMGKLSSGRRPAASGGSRGCAEKDVAPRILLPADIPAGKCNVVTGGRSG